MMVEKLRCYGCPAEPFITMRTLGQELDVLALHGFLHVLGYDHETDDGTMDRLDRRLRRRLL